ncbi:hypothetical protein HUJ04_003603 [Dendroctonus ponderosae]|nr:hypothetical protein HUJ04_003603 [Dendroctonus ponderosae]
MEHEVTEKPFQCNICEKKFTRKFSMKIHLRSVHNVNSAGSRERENIDSHKDRKSFIYKPTATITYSCRFCDFVTTNAERLRRHTKSLHNVDEKPFKCHICGKRFTRQAVMAVHVKKMHDKSNADRVLCQVCGKYYYSKVNLAIHMKLHLNDTPYKCSICDKGFVTDPILQRHLLGHTGDRPYRCHECDKSFFGRTKYELHKMRHTGGDAKIPCKYQIRVKEGSDPHSDNEVATDTVSITKTEAGFQCPYCDKCFPQLCKIKNHLIIHSSERPWKCQVCNKTFKHKRGLDYHEQTVHGESENFPCDICGKIFGNRRNCVVHRNRHSQAYTLKCEECDKRFSRSCSLKKHMIVHSDARPLKCSVCDKSFKHQRVLDYHFKTLHNEGNQEKYPCDICGKLFSNKRNCEIHRKRHQKIFDVFCEHCGKGFLNTFYLKKHLNTKHYGKRHICDVCGASIGDKGNLRNHMKLHDPNYKRPPPEKCDICNKRFADLKRHFKAAHENDGKNYKCEYCNKFFRGKDGLKFHLMIHRGDKPFCCEFCGKRFILNTFLKQHLRTHPESNVKPFKCLYCEKTFIKKSVLDNHTNTHTGDRPFQCEVCSKSFTGRKYLTAHVKSQHSAPSS